MKSFALKDDSVPEEIDINGKKEKTPAGILLRSHRILIGVGFGLAVLTAVGASIAIAAQRRRLMAAGATISAMSAMR